MQAIVEPNGSDETLAAVEPEINHDDAREPFALGGYAFTR